MLLLDEFSHMQKNVQITILKEVFQELSHNHMKRLLLLQYEDQYKGQMCEVQSLTQLMRQCQGLSNK